MLRSLVTTHIVIFSSVLLGFQGLISNLSTLCDIILRVFKKISGRESRDYFDCGEGRDSIAISESNCEILENEGRPATATR